MALRGIRGSQGQFLVFVGCTGHSRFFWYPPLLDYLSVSIVVCTFVFGWSEMHEHTSALLQSSMAGMCENTIMSAESMKVMIVCLTE